jgi:hypothetical protein
MATENGSFETSAELTPEDSAGYENTVKYESADRVIGEA